MVSISSPESLVSFSRRAFNRSRSILGLVLLHRIAVGDTSDLNTVAVAVFDSLSWSIDERYVSAHCKCNTYRRSDFVHGIGVVSRIAKSCTAAGKEDD